MVKLSPMLKEVITHMLRKPFTERYPYERPRIPESFRGLHVFISDLCIGCGLCSKDCPSGAIEMIRGLGTVNDVISGENEISIIVQDAEHSLPKIIETLRTSKILVKKASITKPTLDDVFLRYAGVRLEAASGRISEVRQVRSMIRRG
ncbi:MAG: 4Fe-4S binding protein [Candidatus Bathyarchaeia archaeon]